MRLAFPFFISQKNSRQDTSVSFPNRFVIPVGILLCLSLATITVFQNCGAGFESAQTENLASSSSPNDVNEQVDEPANDERMAVFT